LFAGITPEVQNAIDAVGEEELAQVISFFEQTKLPIGGLIGLEAYQRIKIKNLDGTLS
jgi:hypothetical protein